MKLSHKLIASVLIGAGIGFLGTLAVLVELETVKTKDEQVLYYRVWYQVDGWRTHETFSVDFLGAEEAAKQAEGMAKTLMDAMDESFAPEKLLTLG